MASDELITNSIGQLQDTLRNLANIEAQKTYKEAVPFVHIPNELLAQWDNYPRMLKEAEWFTSLFNAEEISAMNTFDTKISEFYKMYGPNLLDISEILDNEDWQTLVQEANNLMKALRNLFNKYGRGDV